MITVNCLTCKYKQEGLTSFYCNNCSSYSCWYPEIMTVDELIEDYIAAQRMITILNIKNNTLESSLKDVNNSLKLKLALVESTTDLILDTEQGLLKVEEAR